MHFTNGYWMLDMLKNWAYPAKVYHFNGENDRCGVPDF